LNLAVGTYTYKMKAVYSEGVSEMSNPVTISYTLGNNDVVNADTDQMSIYPNPFNPSTNISLSVKNQAISSLKVFNIKGELVNTLLDKQLVSGKMSVSWKGDNHYHQELPSGIYFIRFESGDFQSTKKVLLLK
nr:T9SS type A sorting domain-containing protein [Candidatus Cloacimonadota bacterium]